MRFTDRTSPVSTSVDRGITDASYFTGTLNIRQIIFNIRSCNIAALFRIMTNTLKETLKDTPHFVICDPQKDYSEYLLKFLSDRLNDEYQFHLFHDIQNLSTFSANKNIQILLIGEEYSCTDRYHIPASVRFLLTGCKELSGSTARASPFFSEGSYAQTDLEQPLEHPLFRYQAADQILAQIHDILLLPKDRQGFVTVSSQSEPLSVDFTSDESFKTETISPTASVASPEKTHNEKTLQTEKAEEHQLQSQKAAVDSPVHGIIGVYSPVHRIGKTRFALRLGKQLSGTASVLYLNLEDYCGNLDSFPEKNGQTLEDLLYYMRQDNVNLGLKLSTMIGQIENLDYLAPIRHHQDLCSVRSSEWLELFDMLLEKSIYQVLILDLGDCIDGLYEILKHCSKVYTPYLEDPTAKAKLTQYEENLRSSGYSDVLKHTVRRRIRSVRKPIQRNEVPADGQNKK